MMTGKLSKLATRSMPTASVADAPRSCMDSGRMPRGRPRSGLNLSAPALHSSLQVPSSALLLAAKPLLGSNGTSSSIADMTIASGASDVIAASNFSRGFVAACAARCCPTVPMARAPSQLCACHQRHAEKVELHAIPLPRPYLYPEPGTGNLFLVEKQQKTKVQNTRESSVQYRTTRRVTLNRALRSHAQSTDAHTPQIYSKCELSFFLSM